MDDTALKELRHELKCMDMNELVAFGRKHRANRQSVEYLEAQAEYKTQTGEGEGATARAPAIPDSGSVLLGHRENCVLQQTQRCISVGGQEMALRRVEAAAHPQALTMVRAADDRNPRMWYPSEH